MAVSIPATYTLKPGDFPEKIVRQFAPGLSDAEVAKVAAQMVQQNNIKDDTKIPIGFKMDLSAIPGAGKASPTNTAPAKGTQGTATTGAQGTDANATTSIKTPDDQLNKLLEQYLQYRIQIQKQQMNQQQNPFGSFTVGGNSTVQTNSPVVQNSLGNLSGIFGQQFNPFAQGKGNGRQQQIDPLGLLGGFGNDGGFGRASALAGINAFDARSLAGLLALG